MVSWIFGPAAADYPRNDEDSLDDLPHVTVRTVQEVERLGAALVAHLLLLVLLLLPLLLFELRPLFLRQSLDSTCTETAKPYT